ncbi:MAG: hypothetical protein HFG77_07260 [Hungatella sp.]|nr:hypothetical protein [Hungatella sp.]
MTALTTHRATTILRPFFQFSDEIQKIMYTANIIEGLNRQYRKVTKK